MGRASTQQVPEGWRLVELGAVVRLGTGMVLPTEIRYCNLLHVGPENIEGGTGRLVDVKTAREEGLRTGKYLFDQTALVYAKVRPNLNKVCRPSFSGLCSADAYPVYPNTEVVSRDYLFHSMLSDAFVRQAVATSMRTGMPKINRTDLCRLKVLLPPPEEQERISAILDTWDRAIEQISHLIQAKRRLKKGLVQQVLTGRRRLSGFPEPWQWFRAGEVFGRTSERNHAGEALLSVTQDRGVVPRDMLEARVTMPNGKLESFKLVEPGDFVISLRSFQGGLEHSAYRGVVSPAYTVLRKTKPLSEDFYRHYFKCYEFVGRLAIAVIGIRDGKQVSYDDFSAVSIPYPPLHEQKAIAHVLDRAEREVALLERQLELLRSQKKGLMQKLLTGEIRVKV